MECIKLFGVFIPKPPSPPSTTLPSNLPPQELKPPSAPLSFVTANEIRLQNPVEQPASSSSPPPEPVLVKPKRIIKRPRLRPPQPPQELPQIYCNFIVNEGLYGNSLRLIFTRRLNVTDMNRRHKRLSMPCKQTMEGFLTSGEEDLIRKSMMKGNRLLKKKIDVMVVDPLLKIHRMKLAKWNDGVDDKNKNKKKSWWYALTTDWNKLADDNGLAVGDAIQVWSFRTKGGDLGFIIHKIG